MFERLEPTEVKKMVCNTKGSFKFNSRRGTHMHMHMTKRWYNAGLSAIYTTLGW